MTIEKQTLPMGKPREALYVTTPTKNKYTILCSFSLMKSVLLTHIWPFNTKKVKSVTKVKSVNCYRLKCFHIFL